MTLSVRQPHASLMVGGYKPVETRPWRTNHRGSLVIHAAAAFPGHLRELCRSRPRCSMLRDMGYERISQLPLGAAIGMVDVIDCVQVTPENQRELKRRWDYPLNTDLWIWLWVLDNPRRFIEPVPMIGRLRLWPYPNILMPDCLLAA